MRSTFDPTLARVLGAWRKLADRERALLAMLALFGLVALTLSSLDWSEQRREAHALAAATAAGPPPSGRDSLAGTDAYQARLLSEGSVRGSDIWMARIGLEQLLVAATGTAGIAAPRIIIAPPDETGPALPVLQAEIIAPYDGAALVRLLEALAAGPAAYFVDSLSVDKDQAGEFRLVLSFPVAIAVEGAGE